MNKREAIESFPERQSGLSRQHVVADTSLRTVKQVEILEALDSVVQVFPVPGAAVEFQVGPPGIEKAPHCG